MKDLFIEIEEELFRKLKIRAAKELKTLKELITPVLERLVK